MWGQHLVCYRLACQLCGRAGPNRAPQQDVSPAAAPETQQPVCVSCCCCSYLSCLNRVSCRHRSLDPPLILAMTWRPVPWQASGCHTQHRPQEVQPAVWRAPNARIGGWICDHITRVAALWCAVSACTCVASLQAGHTRLGGVAGHCRQQHQATTCHIVRAKVWQCGTAAWHTWVWPALCFWRCASCVCYGAWPSTSVVTLVESIACTTCGLLWVKGSRHTCPKKAGLRAGTHTDQHCWRVAGCTAMMQLLRWPHISGCWCCVRPGLTGHQEECLPQQAGGPHLVQLYGPEVQRLRLFVWVGLSRPLVFLTPSDKGVAMLACATHPCLHGLHVTVLGPPCHGLPGIAICPRSGGSGWHMSAWPQGAGVQVTVQPLLCRSETEVVMCGCGVPGWRHNPTGLWDTAASTSGVLFQPIPCRVMGLWSTAPGDAAGVASIGAGDNPTGRWCKACRSSWLLATHRYVMYLDCMLYGPLLSSARHACGAGCGR